MYDVVDIFIGVSRDDMWRECIRTRATMYRLMKRRWGW